MEKTKTFLSGMFDVKTIMSTPHLPFFFTLILILLVFIVLIFLSVFDAPAEAYSVLVALIPFAAGIVNNLNKTGT